MSPFNCTPCRLRRCSLLGITLFTIAHQKSVLRHHPLVLRFDGKGGWALFDREKGEPPCSPGYNPDDPWRH